MIIVRLCNLMRNKNIFVKYSLVELDNGIQISWHRDGGWDEAEGNYYYKVVPQKGIILLVTNAIEIADNSLNLPLWWMNLVENII